MRMDVHRTAWRSQIDSLDNRVVNWFQHHLDLALVLANVSFIIWAVVTQRLGYALGMVLIGALGYFAGVILGVGTSAILLAISVIVSNPAHVWPSPLVVEIIGYVIIAWLGFRHKRLKEEQLRMQQETHPVQQLPWAMVNEVRTSLAAIRFLLFPLNGNEDSQELQRVTNELTRLEKMFQDMEQDQKRNTLGHH